MSFEKAYLIVPLVIIMSLYVFMSIRRDGLLTRIIKENWLLKTNKVFWLRKLLFYTGIVLLTFSLLDHRGEVIKVEGSIPDQKTVMIIDTSSSMFVEDVRPNRYKRAIFLARHFVKKAVGHQISVVLFSDIQKRIVPFTDDLDLLDARLSAMENDIGAGGGSNLSQAIEESLQYFKTTSEKDGIRSGNLLILTDSEGHDGELRESVSDKINVALIGVGTARGGKVPIRDSRGVFRGYKKYNDVEVESKLNEAWMKSLGSKIKSYKYWIANSYSMPTLEVIDFFRSTFMSSLSKGNVSIRPVLFHRTAVAGIVLIILSYITYPFKSFSAVIVLLFFSFSGIETRANEVVKSEKTYALESKLRSGEITEAELVYFIEELLKDKSYEKAAQLYEERLDALDPLSLNNYGLALVGLKKKDEALVVFRKAEGELVDVKGSAELLRIVRGNILLLLKKQKEDNDKKKDKKEDKKKDEKEKNQENKKNNKSEDDSDESKDQKQKENSDSKQNKEKSEKEKSKDKQNEKNNKKQKNEENKSDKKKGDEKDKKDNEGEKRKSMQEKIKEKEKEDSLKRKMKKIPGVIKQIMSDDRELQRKHIDTSTQERSNYKKRDW